MTHVTFLIVLRHAAILHKNLTQPQMQVNQEAEFQTQDNNYIDTYIDKSLKNTVNLEFTRKIWDSFVEILYRCYRHWNSL